MSKFSDSLVFALYVKPSPNDMDAALRDADAIVTSREMMAIQMALYNQFVKPYMETLSPERALEMARGRMVEAGLPGSVIEWVLEILGTK